MSGDQEPWSFLGGLTAELQVSKFILYFLFMLIIQDSVFKELIMLLM